MRSSWYPILCLVVLAACGDGGGGGGGGGGTTSNPDRGPAVFYVRHAGSDANDGQSPQTAFGTMAGALANIRDGDMVIVGPGTYREMVDVEVGVRANPSGIEFLADPRGELTGDAPGDVVIDATGRLAGFRISRSAHVSIDGFRITGARDQSSGAAIVVRDASDGARIRHCVLFGNRDGIRLQNSGDALIFNNLIVDNANRGIRVSDGSVRARIINNTVANNGNRGIDIGGTNQAGAAAAHARLRNNIVQNNRTPNIAVAADPPSALEGYDGDYNLVYQEGLRDQRSTYLPPHIAGQHDVNGPARLVNPSRGDYRLDGSRSPAIDAGDEIDADLLAELLERSATRDGQPDAPPVDLGYHFPIAASPS